MSFKLQRSHYTKGIAFCITPISPRYGGGTYFGGTISNPNDNTTLPSLVPNWIRYRGRSILGHQPPDTNYVYAVAFSTVGPSSTLIPQLTTSKSDWTGDFSILLLGDYKADATFSRVLIQGNQTAGGGGVEILSNFSSASVSVVTGTMTILGTPEMATISGYADSAASAIDGKPHCWIFRRQSGVFSIYKDGVSNAAATSNSNVAVGSTQAFMTIGGLSGNPETHGPALSTQALCVGWNRALADGEIVQLGSNPFLLFQDPEDIYFNFALVRHGRSFGYISG